MSKVAIGLPTFNEEENIASIILQLKKKYKLIPWLYNESIKDFIKQNEKELTHIIVNDDKKLPKFLSDVYYNENKYNFLILKKDYKKSDFSSKLKKFKIDYDQFNMINKQEMGSRKN